MLSNSEFKKLTEITLAKYNFDPQVLYGRTNGDKKLKWCLSFATGEGDGPNDGKGDFQEETSTGSTRASRELPARNFRSDGIPSA